METKVYILKNLCCANCAAQIEEKFNAHSGVEKATIVFNTRQLRLTAEEPDELVEELTRIARSVEPDVVITPREERSHQHQEHDHGGCERGHHHEEHEHDRNGCCCGHHHEQHQHGHGACGCGHHHEEHDHESRDHAGHGAESPVGLLAGAGLFVLGLVTKGWWSTGFFLAALVVLGWEIAVKAVRGLFRGRVLDENFLMSAAAIGAFLIGNAAEGVGVMLFYRVGEYFEHRAVERSRSQIMDAVDLLSLIHI